MLITFSIGLIIVAVLGFLLGRSGQGGLTKTIRYVLWGVLGSLIAYNYYALNMPGTAWMDGIGLWAGLFTTLVGGATGLVIYWLSLKLNGVLAS